MGDGGGGYDGGVGIRGGFFERRENPATISFRCFGGAILVGIENAGQIGVLRFMNDAKMISAEGTGSDDGNASAGHCYPLDRLMRAMRY